MRIQCDNVRISPMSLAAIHAAIVQRADELGYGAREEIAGFHSIVNNSIGTRRNREDCEIAPLRFETIYLIDNGGIVLKGHMEGIPLSFTVKFKGGHLPATVMEVIRL